MSQILNKAKPVRVEFNPRNKKHLASFKKFLETGSWGDVKFQLIAPYVTIPHMVLTMFALEKLKAETVPLPAARFSAAVVVADPVVDAPNADFNWLNLQPKLRRVV